MNYCSFCGRSEEETRLLIKGIDGYICEHCLNDAYAAMNAQHLDASIENTDNEFTDIPKPKEIKAYLDEYVIGQDKTKEKIATAVYNHYKRINYNKTNPDVVISKSNCLIVGSSGTGKTYIAQTVAKLLKVPFCIVDATAFTEAGYVGEDVESILSRLLQAADYDVEKAEHGIVFIDEIDKIAKKGENMSITRDVSGEGVQQSFLKIIEGSDVLVPPEGGRKHPEQKMIKMNTTNILFICSGAFVGIEKRIAARQNRNLIGFNSVENKAKENKDENILKYITPEDVKKFGLIPELVGRIPIICYTDDLEKPELKRILTEPKNALVKQYEELFKIDGKELQIDSDVYDVIVDHAYDNKLGARGLRGVIESIMSKQMFEFPSSDETVCHITKAYAEEQLNVA